MDLGDTNDCIGRILIFSHDIEVWVDSDSLFEMDILSNAESLRQGRSMYYGYGIKQARGQKPDPSYELETVAGHIYRRQLKGQKGQSLLMLLSDHLTTEATESWRREN